MKLPENLRSGFMNEEVENYLYELLPKRDEVLSEMEEYAAQHKVPIIGPAVARMLALLVQISGAKRIFELGSAIGYSAIWLARAAGPQSEITYTDGDPKNAKRAKAYFERAGVTQQIRVETGDALTLLKKTPGEFDLIFNDINKREYPEAATQALPRLRRGGLFITDNTLWSGKAARKAKAGDADTRGVQELNRLVHQSKDLFSVLIPLRDGVTICRKL
ncbi:MAG TPA: O-methyltransferase [Candidatus Acidoferrum sp.]|nr:O-methyltransferase [Candidatus Acidoferrum sp.]